MAHLRFLLVIVTTAFFLFLTPSRGATNATKSELIPDAPRAIYGWIPEYNKLFLRLGGDYYSTSSNFATDGYIDTLPNAATLTMLRFWVEPEYGIAQDWSVKLHVGYLTGSVTPPSTTTTPTTTPLLSNSSLDDIRANVRWNFKAADPILTADLIVQFPVAPSKPTIQTDLALGDGAFDAGLLLHGGHRSGGFLLSLSPGLLFRSNDYSTLALVEGAAQYEFSRVYLRVIGNFIYSFGNTVRNDTAGNSALGSGGSYAILSDAPVGFAAGGKVGVRLHDNVFLEAGASHAIVGSRYPSFLNFTVNLFNSWDFYKPLKVKKVKEVPFEETGEPQFKGK